MTLMQIGFLVAGLLLFIASFFISEKLSSSDLNEIKKVGEKEINIILEKELNDAQYKISEAIDSRLGEAMNRLDVRTDRQTNEKIMSIEEYSTTVLNSIDESHKQVMFMYNMLVEKQEKLTQLTADIQKMESNLRVIKDHLEKQYEDILPEDDDTEEETPLEDVYIEQTIEEAFGKEIPATSDIHKEKIIQMYNEGASEIEIAKSLGKGLGEIKLVLGLFHEEYS